MATEDIKVQDGRIVVERVGNKQNVDVAVSDVESVSYIRGFANATGALVLHTKSQDFVINVEVEDAGAALALVNNAGKKPVAKKVTDDK